MIQVKKVIRMPLCIKKDALKNKKNTPMIIMKKIIN